MAAIQVGHRSPDVTAPTHDGQHFVLSDFRGHKVVVLFFYPADGSLVCTAEACAFRDAYTSFTDAGAAVVGVSGDSLDAHRGFVANHKLPFQLLSDADGQIRKAFGVPKTLGLFPGRVTYVIDKKGIVRHIFSSQLAASQHVAEALKVVEQLLREST